MQARASERTPLAVFRAKEWIGVDWPRTLVTYRVVAPGAQADYALGSGLQVLSRPVAPEQTRIIDQKGNEVPAQWSLVERNEGGTIRSACVSFFAALEPNTSFEYSLVEERPTENRGAVRVTREQGQVVLEGERVAVRMPLGQHVLTEPAALADLPGPLGGVRLADGSWTASARFVDANGASPRVTRWAGRIVEEGPLFAEVVVRYELDNGGFYQMTVRLIAGESGVRIDEQMDLRSTRRDRDWRVEIPLVDSDGRFRPDVAWWCSPGGRLRCVDEAFERAADEAGFAPITQEAFGDRRFISSSALTFGNERRVIAPVAVWYPYHAVAQYVAVGERAAVASSTPETRNKIRFAAVVPVHAGNWRGIPENFNGELVSDPGGQVVMAWPLTVGPHPNSVLHMGEEDPQLPYTHIRRQWMFLAGPMQYHTELMSLRRFEGYINLDDYKDWVLEWKTEREPPYPRLVLTKDRVEKLRSQLDSHPMGEQLRTLLYFNDDPKRARKLIDSVLSGNVWHGARGHAVQTLGRDDQSMRYLGWVSGFRDSQRAAWTHAADEVLSSQHLTGSERHRLRAYIAAVCYILTEPDYNPRGTMVHLGNPNMSMNRFFALTFAAELIPDHPRAEDWLGVSSQYARYMLARSTAPDGSWSELLTYYMAGACHVLQGASVLELHGRLDEDTLAVAKTAAKYPLSLIAPVDPRFDARVLPAWGHEGYWMVPTHWLLMASMLAERDPSLSSAFAWAWESLGRSVTDHHDAGFSGASIAYADKANIANAPTAQLKSRWIPGFGATMRAHAGDPNEVFLAYRQGYMVSHSDANQGDFLIYAKGAPMTVPGIFQYGIYDKRPFEKMYTEFGWHNRVRFGEQNNTGGWPGGGIVSQVHRFDSGPSTDYLRGVGHYESQEWTRQILFLKGRAPADPNYFVFRESFAPLDQRPLERKWWYLRTDGDRSRVSSVADGFRYSSPTGPVMDVRFVEPANVAVESRDVTQEGPLYNRVGELWKAQGNPFEKNHARQTMTITAAGPIDAGQDITAVLYPRAKDQPEPTYRSLAPGVTQVTTTESVDTVFVGATPLAYKDASYSFVGRAGAVRVFDDVVHLIVSEAPAEIGYRGLVLKAAAPTTKVISLKDLKPGVIEHAAPAHSIVMADPPSDVQIETVRPGVRVWRHAGNTTWHFDSPEPIQFEHDRVVFHGRRGAVVAGPEGNARLTVLEGDRIGHGPHQVWGGDGPFEIIYKQDSISVRHAGVERFIYMTRPSGMAKLPTMVVDGKRFMPGLVADLRRRDIATTGDPYDINADGTTLIVPLARGEHAFRIQELEQPPVFRNWQAWMKRAPG